MEKKKKSWMSLLNPLEWIQAAFSLLAAVFAPLLRWLGMLTPPRTDGFENIRKEDVEDAKQLAEQQEAAVDTLVREMSPGEVVRAYARADAAGRAEMDLRALDLAQQDWLLGLSKEDLDKLGMSTTSACARSLEAMEVWPAYPKPSADTETAEICTIPTEEEVEEAKRQQIAALYRQVQRELWLAPGVPNLNPKHTPVTTLH
jgi:nucleotide-binding universal stress UspA family protein